MKKLFLTLTIIFLFIGKTLAYTDSEYLSLVEKKLFFTQYKSEQITKRIERIEKSVYGKTSKAPVVSRIAKLKTVYSFEEPKPVQPVKKVSTVVKKPIKKTNISKKTTPINNDIKYPQISEIEKMVLQKSYEKENIYLRLDRLELEVLGYKSNAELSDRVEGIKLAVYGNKPPTTASSNQNIQNSMQNNGSNNEMQISEIENNTLQTTYPTEPVESRLARLEQHYFNSVSEGDDIEDRIERLSAVANAEQGSQEYRDIPAIRQYQNAASAVSIVGIGLMLIQSLLH